ncbi:MAG: zinc-dependent alcohol dehydrogenase family protein [Bdellovibrionales bacterium]|nr:zinc-dependent alcohol dehydrogenase family protein [Bdellovibrionales bacterium]
MIAVTYERPGEPKDVLNVTELPTPTPNDNQLLLKMIRIPIVPADLATIRGLYRTPQKTPCIPGYGGIGEIVSLGKNVTGYEMGTRVMTLPFKNPGWTDGCWCEYICLEESEVLPIKHGRIYESGFDFFNTPLTAYVMTVDILNLSKGNTVLLTAAGSNVGRMVLSLAKERGFSVIGVVRRPEQVEEILSLGATHVICSSQADITQKAMEYTKLKGVDAVLDSVGGEVSTQCFKALGDWGKMIVYGLLALERNAQFDIRKMLFYNLDVRGFWLPAWWKHTSLQERTEAVNETLNLIEKGVLDVHVEKAYRLEDIKEAVSHAERPGNSGRIVLDP